MTPKIDYNKCTDEEFDKSLEEILNKMTGAQLLAIPSMYEVVSEHFNKKERQDE